MRNAKMIVFGLLAAFLAMGLTACSSSKKEQTKQQQPAQQQQAQPQMKTVVLYGHKFNPNTLTVPAGTTIKFTNKDPDRYNVNIPALNVDKTLAAGESFQYTFNTSGEFAVSNRFARGNPMKMTITVQ